MMHETKPDEIKTTKVMLDQVRSVESKAVEFNYPFGYTYTQYTRVSIRILREMLCRGHSGVRKSNHHCSTVTQYIK